jgi:hypothetical protein
MNGAQDHTSCLFASNASCQRGAHSTTGHRASTLESRILAWESKDRYRAIWKTRERLKSTRRRPCDCQSPPARYYSSRLDRSPSWALLSRFQAIRRARFGRQAADRLHRSYRPSALSYLSNCYAQASGASSRSGTKVSKCKLTAVCQSRQPLSLKSLYPRREVVLPLQWPYASGIESSSGLALLRGDTHRSGNHASMRRQFGLVLFGDRQYRRCTDSGRGCGSAFR